MVAGVLRKIVVLVFIILAFSFPRQTNAEDTLILDSTNKYLGACQLTDKSAWELTEDANIGLFRIWYRWDQNETKLPVTIFREGEKFAEITVSRSQCDPYQAQWCNGDFQVNKLFPKGKYSTQIANARQCLRPGGTGTILLYEAKSAAAQSPVIPAAAPTSQPVVGSCTNNVILAAVLAGVAGFIIAFFIFRKR